MTAVSAIGGHKLAEKLAEEPWYYRITLPNGCRWVEKHSTRVWRPLEVFRQMHVHVTAVDELSSAGRWVPSMLLPQCQEEASALPVSAAADEDMEEVAIHATVGDASVGASIQVTSSKACGSGMLYFG